MRPEKFNIDIVENFSMKYKKSPKITIVLIFNFRKISKYSLKKKKTKLN